MRLKDLHLLPKVRDSWSYLYVEHCKIDQDDQAIAFHDQEGTTPVPCASLTLLMLGPGTSITQAAIKVLAECGCLVMWCGEESVRFYALGIGETRSAANTLHQARVWSDPAQHLAVVRRMYEMRFNEMLDPALTLEMIRGREGLRMRKAYAQASEQYGVTWEGRSYRRTDWRAADPINRALSAANSCLYGVCHAAIVSAGFSTALGFIHTGKMLSFVYDVGDLYKTEITIPVAFQTVNDGAHQLERRTRMLCREHFRTSRFLERIIPDIQRVLDANATTDAVEMSAFEVDDALPGGLWSGGGSVVAGGTNYADAPDDDEEDDARKE